MKRITANSFRSSGLRGCNFQYLADWVRQAQDWDDLAALGANHARIWLDAKREGNAYALGAEQLQRMDVVLRELQKRKMYAIPVMRIPDADRQYGAWAHPDRLRSLATLWADIAKRFRRRLAIAAFDILNEPVPPGGSFKERQAEWAKGAEVIVREIQAIDPTRVCIVEAAPNALPEALTNVEPIPGVVYSIHDYVPFNVTHATVVDGDAGISYTPDHAAERYLALRECFAWAARTGAPVYVGETSCRREVKGSEQWLADGLALYRGFGWSFAYHEWRSWPGWDVEAIGTESAYRRGLTPGVQILRDGLRE